MVAEACKIVLELHIPKEVLLEAKIRKLAAGMGDAKVEVARVQFEMNMKITELELKSQPSTPPAVIEQDKVAIKDGVSTVDVAVVDYTALFE